MRWLFVLFFASGATALVYQVLWVRLLTIVLGTSVAAVATVLTLFMLGLALGAEWSGRWADLRTRPLARYAFLELGIAVWGVLTAVSHHLALAFVQACTEWLPVTAQAELLIRPLVAGIWLLPPTCLIGATLPVAATSLPTTRQVREQRLTGLYTANTLGAVLGGLAAALLLIPALGVTGSLLLASGLNLLLAAGGWSLDRLQQREIAGDAGKLRTLDETSGPVAVDSASVAPPPRGARSAAPRETLMLVAVLSGFLTLAVEVLWSRFYGLLLTSNVLVIAVLISGYLCGLGLGSLLVVSLSLQVRSRPSVLGASLLSSSAGLALVTLGQPRIGTLFATLHRSGLETDWSGPLVSARCLLGLFMLVALPATAFGTVLPLVLCQCVRSPWTIGRDVGRVLGANTLGSILGAATAGFVMLPHFGLTTSLLICGAVYAGLAVVVATPLRWRIAVAGCALVLAAGPFWFRQQVSKVWFNGGFTGVTAVPQREVLFYRDGPQATVAVLQKQDVTCLLVDGTVVAETSHADLWDLLLKAHLPMLLHDEPRRVALVGLGAGISLGAVQSYPNVERIDCIELCADVLDTLPYFATRNDRCWLDPRTRILVDDGRHYLLRTRERYDVISVDPVDPPICNQYSQDFLAVCRERLAPGGYLVQWLPLFHLRHEHVRVVIRAFLNVFPEATLWYDGTAVLLVGRRDAPVRVPLARFLQRARIEGVQDNLRLIDSPHPLCLLATYVWGSEELARFIDADVPANTDDRPYLEYTLLHSGPLSRDAMLKNLELFVSFERPVEDWVDWGPDPDAEAASDVSGAQARAETWLALETLRRLRGLLGQLHAARLHRLREEFEAADAILTQVRDGYGLSERDLRAYRAFLE